ncbi:MAG: L,D-transpeptidase family protein [Actinomycetota bacterium]|nr:L,D-transpeptidase family protein [Actinomycetota bacterium]
MSGADVTALQTRLSGLGYWNGKADGTYGYVTSQAVIAYQKAAGINADGVAGPATRAALTKNILPTPRTTFGNALEVDKDKQLLMIVIDGQLRYVIHVSTGSGATFLEKGDSNPHVAVTPSGTFAIQRAINGLRTSKLGTLWRPRYFDDYDGIAIHGEGVDVPPYPASHGCVRMSDPAIDFIWATNLAPIGRTVLVY